MKPPDVVLTATLEVPSHEAQDENSKKSGLETVHG